MKILSITAQKPHSTGSGTYLTELVRSWHRQGHEQAVVCGIYPGDMPDFPAGVCCFPVYFDPGEPGMRADRAPDIPFPIVGMSDIMPYPSTRYRDMTPEMTDIFEESFIRAVSRAVDQLEPDLIVCHHLFMLTAMVRRHFPHIRIAGISHGTDLRQMENCPALADVIRPHVARLDRVLALHDDQKHRIAEIFGISEDRILVAGSGYNDALFNTTGRQTGRGSGDAEGAGGPVRLCYAGKMSRPKGVPELLAALSELSQDPEVPEFELTLAGGCQDEAVMSMLRSLPAYARWLGQIPQTALAELLRHEDIFVLPSYFEGLPLVLIEAMASGAVPVCTDLDGVRPWLERNVPGQNAVFIPAPEMESIDTPTVKGRESFTAALRDSLRDLIIAMGSGTFDAGRPDTSGITWDSAAARVLDGAAR